MSSEKDSAKYPKAIPYIIGNEAAERFNYYGMRAILSTFLIAQFFNPSGNTALNATAEAESNELSHLFVTISYFMPLIGGFLADWFFGKYKVILYVSLLYCFGSLLLAFNTTNLDMFKVGLLVIACGAGGIKSCVSANVGDQFTAGNKHLMSKVYGWFYFSINAGSIVSTALVPWLYKNYGAGIAFGIPGGLMILATIIFFLGRDLYIKIPPAGFKNKESSVFTAENFKAVSSVLAVFAFIPLFWAMWDQCLAEWVIQAQKLDLKVTESWTLIPEQVQTINPFFLITLIPVFTYGIYPFFEKIGLKPTPLRKIGVGLALTAGSFVVIAFIEQWIEAGEKPSFWWQILAYLLLSAGEVMVSITGLEYAYTNSPKSMKSIMTALWLLTVSLGNYFVVIINSSIKNKGFFSQYTGSNYFWFFVKLMMVQTIIFAVVSNFIKEKNYVEDDDSELSVD
jgi:proton-dependent oligopeptide transporter, POT family